MLRLAVNQKLLAAGQPAIRVEYRDAGGPKVIAGGHVDLEGPSRLRWDLNAEPHRVYLETDDPVVVTTASGRRYRVRPTVGAPEALEADGGA